MSIFDSLPSEQGKVDGLNKNAAEVYAQAVDSFMQQAAQYQVNAQREFTLSKKILAPPEVPLLKVFDLVKGVATELASVNKLGLSQPVFIPEVPRGGSSIAASLGASNTEMLQAIGQICERLEAKLDKILAR